MRMTPPTALALLLCVCARALAHNITTSKPNILMMVVDDLGSNDVGFMQKQHGFARPAVRTPEIDRLARDGLVLDQYYVDTVCSPTRATLMTGRYPIHNTINDYIHPETAWGLPLNESTLPELLGAAGYTCHAIGKWHLGYFKWEYTPTFRGFNSFLGYYEGAEDYFTHTRSGAYDLHLERSARCGAGCSLVPDRRGEYSVNVFSDEAVRVIEQGRDQLKPWFLYLAWQSIHSPHQAPQAYLDLYNASMPGRTVAAMLSALDDGVANVTAALNRTGQTDNTLIIFTSDNGGTAGSSNYPLRGEKHSIYEGGVRGAAFLAGWGIAPQLRGRSTAQLLHAADFLPTLVDSVAGGSTHGTLPLDGRDQWSFFSGVTTSSNRTEVLYGHESGPSNCGLRNGTWKLLRAGGDQPSKWDPPGYGLVSATSSLRRYASEGASFAAQCASPATYQNGTCHPGNDLGSQQNVANAQACCALCATRDGCTVGQWRADNHKCFLKRKLGVGSVGPCMAAVLGPPGPDPTPAPGPVTLYNLAQDPYEHTDVSGKHPDIVTSMLARLKQVDKNLRQAGEDKSCPPRTPANDSAVGKVWMPWC